MLTKFLNYTPLEQFDDVSWVYYDFLLEGVDVYSKYVFELEYDIFSLTTLNGNSIYGSLSSTFGLFLILLLIYVGKTLGYTFW
jgi:hypothetical protein